MRQHCGCPTSPRFGKSGDFDLSTHTPNERLSMSDNPSLLKAEAQVQAHSSDLRRELGLLDLILAQTLLVVVPDFFGTAVKAGPAHVFFWLAAIVLFFIPLALLVAHLSRLMPLEGGLYEWARLAFNDQIGFLVAWNLWLFVILYVAVIGVVTVTFATYVLPGLSWIASNKWLISAASAAWIAAMTFVAARGLQLGKWVSNIGGIVILMTIAVLVLAPWLNLWRGALTQFHPSASYFLHGRYSALAFSAN